MSTKWYHPELRLALDEQYLRNDLSGRLEYEFSEPLEDFLEQYRLCYPVTLNDLDDAVTRLRRVEPQLFKFKIVKDLIVGVDTAMGYVGQPMTADGHVWLAAVRFSLNGDLNAVIVLIDTRWSCAVFARPGHDVVDVGLPVALLTREIAEYCGPREMRP